MSGVLICNAGIRRKPENDWETDIGYKITPECRRQSYATEGAADLVTYGFNQMELHQISPWRIVENRASARALEKLGPGENGNFGRPNSSRTIGMVT